MKKNFMKVIAAGAILASSAGLVACSNDDDLKYTIYNYDNTYIVNETFSLQGAKLKITNEDGTETEITISDDMIKTMPDMSTAGTKKVTIIYDGNEFTLNIEVVNANVINHTISGYKTSYFTTDEFDLNNLKLKLFYNNATSETFDVTQSMIEEMPNMSTAGTKTVVVLHNGNRYSFTISVVELSVSNYSISGYEDSYFTNDSFSMDNLKLHLSYNNNTQETIDIESSMIESMPDMSIPGAKTIIVNYNNRQYQFTINVIAPSQISYEITGFESSYFTDDEFVVEDLNLHINYVNNTQEDIDISEAMIEELPDMSTAGAKTIIVNYNNKQYQFTINVVAPSETSYAVSGYKASYFTTEELDLTNLKLKLFYNNYANEIISVTETMIEELPDMAIAGSKTIVILHNGNRYSFTINVVIPEETSYVVLGYNNSYFTNSTFTTEDLKLTIYYNDGLHQEIDIAESMIETMPDMSTAGTKTIVVNYNGKHYSFTISVVETIETSYSVAGFKSSYFTSEAFTTENLKLTINYNDGSSKEINVLDSMIKQTPNMTIPGNKTVVVLYGENEYQFTIYVVAPQEIGRQIIGYQQVYDINSVFDLAELSLKINYEDTSFKDVPITAGMIDEMPDMTIEGMKTIVVIYNGLSTQITFEVKDIAKAEMMEKIQNFMNDYNSADVKTSGIKINVEGTAKYLEDNVEFNEQLINYAVSSVANLEGYQIGKLGDSYVFVKNFDTMDELNAEWCMIDLFNTDYIVMLQCQNESYSDSYGTLSMDDIMHMMEYEEMVEITAEEFKDGLQLTTFWSDEDKEISIFNSKLARPIYKAITNAIVNSTMDIKKDDIISAKDNLTAQLDILKTLQNINTNVTNIDFYNHFVNDMLLTENNSHYVDLARTYIAEMFEITDQNTLDELDYALTKDIKKIRNNQLQDLETTYDMIVELNNIIKASDGNPTTINQLDIIVSGIDSQDKHMLSKFIYSLKDFAQVYYYTYGETEDYEEANAGNRRCTGYYHNGTAYVYTYEEEVPVEADELIDEYYTGLKSFVERFENIESYTNVKTFAYDIIRDLRAMDQVVQELEANEYESELMNFYITSNVRMAVEYYIEMYDAEMIADIIDMLGQAMPEGAKQYEVLSESMCPELCAGDIVTVEAQESYEVGNIICFNETYRVVHRVIGKLEEGGTTYYICHGDNVQSANPSNYGYAYWEDDASYIQGLINQGKTISQIRDTAYNIQIVAEEQIEGKVTGVNQMYLELPANLVEALKDCADTIYLAFGKSEVDYIKLIEDICDRLELEKDYYIEKYNAGEMTIFADAFDKYVKDWDKETGVQLEFNTAIRNACVYMDRLFVYGTDRTELLNEIHKCAVSAHKLYLEQEETYPEEELMLDALVKLTNTEQGFNENAKDLISEYKSTIKEYSTMMLSETFQVSNNENAIKELDHIINYYLTAYLKDEFVVGDLIAEMNEFIDTYCEEDVRTYAKSIAILTTLMMNKNQDIDYNELFGSIELPNEIKEVDFNKLINETLKDNETYDILNLEDVKVDYITDEEGNITKEILTISLNANYDILLSSMDAKISLTIEINF